MIFRTSRWALFRVTVVFTLLLLSIAGTACAPKVVSGSEREAQKQLNALTTWLANGPVASIDILHFPDRIETEASVTPENLERWLYCRITISRIREWAGREELIEVMRSAKVSEDSRMPDLRSAVIFYGSDGHRIGALYFSRFFRAEGGIGSMPVSFRGDLAGWLKHMIPSSLQ